MKKTSIFIAAILALCLCGSAVWAACVWVCDYNTTAIAEQKDKDGRRSVWTEETRDEHGALVGRRVDTYTYYPDGSVKDINQAVYDSADKKVSEKTVTHYPDKQPTVATLQAASGEVEK